ncbi:hypothetical protein Tco_1300483 [Tanacetum coccineum]
MDSELFEGVTSARGMCGPMASHFPMAPLLYNGGVIWCHGEKWCHEKKSWFRWISFYYRVTLGFGSIAGGLDHVNHVIRLPLECGISRVLGLGDHPNPNMGDDVDISALTIEQYLALIQDNNRPGIVKPKISDDVEFEINSHFMRELRCKLLQDLLEKEFIWKYCSPFKTAKKLKEIRSFKQEMCETLYQAWERYNDMLFKCPQHDLNNHQKVQIFYTGVDISTRRMLESRGFIPLMTPTQALKSIQVMATIYIIGAHLTKECPLEKEDKTVEQRKYMRSLEEAIIKFYEESIKKQTADDE